MTINPVFNSFQETSEQDLLDDLIQESIMFAGEDVRYIPRHLANFDQLFGADDSSRYNSTYGIEMYVKSVLGFSGDKDFYSAFGHQIRDEVVFSVSKTRWLEEIGVLENQQTPNEGDLIYFPLNKKCFVIKYVDPREMFYQLGRVYTWELTCEVFEYSGEDFETGDPDIDKITTHSTNIVDWAVVDSEGKIITDSDGNIIIPNTFDLGEIDPGSENVYLPPELLDITGFNLANVDPFSSESNQ